MDAATEPTGKAALSHPCDRGISASLHVIHGVSCEGLLPLLPAVSDSPLLKRIDAQLLSESGTMQHEYMQLIYLELNPFNHYCNN